jgi:hypothetical protein
MKCNATGVTTPAGYYSERNSLTGEVRVYPSLALAPPASTRSPRIAPVCVEPRSQTTLVRTTRAKESARASFVVRARPLLLVAGVADASWPHSELQ